MLQHRARSARNLLAFSVLAALAVTACSSSPDATDGETDPTGTTDEAASALTRQSAVSRADAWVGVKLHYCQAPNHARDFDSACAHVCNRHDNPQWNPYRSDCSGLVSWAWGLPAPGRTTLGFAPYQTDITHTIEASALEEGDAVNNRDHVMLFKRWVVKDHKAVFIEEPGCSSATPYAHEVTTAVSISGTSIHVVENGMTFTAIRYRKI